MKQIALAAALLLAQPVAAQDAAFSVKRGETIRIFSWSYFGDTCKRIAFPSVRAIRGATLGTLSSGQAPMKINRVVDQRQANCIGRSVDGTVVNYTAGDTTGSETITLGRTRLSGPEARYNISITVK